MFSVVFLTFLATPMESLPVFIAESNTQESATETSEIVMDTTTANLLSQNNKISVFVPGESTEAKESREKAQAAKAKADADAQAEKLAQSTRNTVAREYRVYTDPVNFDDIYARAESVYGVDRKLLKAVHIVETGASGSTGLSNPSGATGPMQFLPSTFRRHAQDGNGDGIADIQNVEDAIYSAAQYMIACGYPNVKDALWGYNPSTAYYNKVMRVYNGL